MPARFADVKSDSTTAVDVAALQGEMRAIGGGGWATASKYFMDAAMQDEKLAALEKYQIASEERAGVLEEAKFERGAPQREAQLSLTKAQTAKLSRADEEKMAKMSDLDKERIKYLTSITENIQSTPEDVAQAHAQITKVLAGGGESRAEKLARMKAEREAAGGAPAPVTGAPTPKPAPTGVLGEVDKRTSYQKEFEVKQNEAKTRIADILKVLNSKTYQPDEATVKALMKEMEDLGKRYKIDNM